jgi:hypothetical protein
MKRNTVFFILLFGLFLAVSSAYAESSFFEFDSKNDKEHPVATAVAEKITATIKKLPQEGSHINKIELIDGIRAMDDEIASVGEIKILVNLDWQTLPDHPQLRQALDNTTAHIINAVFSEHTDITKMRVIIKIPKNGGKYKSAAKVFAFTRATWELTKNNPRFEDAANLLALGDYVILSDKGWIRGY